MSRIGKKIIQIPAGVDIKIGKEKIDITGPKGALSHVLLPNFDARMREGILEIAPGVLARQKRKGAEWGLLRSLIAKKIEGVTRGFEKKLELEGIGYRAQLDGTTIVLHVGFTHPVRVDAPSGISFKVERNSITVIGIDAAEVGEMTARIRRIRPPEPYKGKGIRYAGEIIRRKAGKKAVTGGS